MPIRWIVTVLLVSLSAGLAQAQMQLPKTGVAAIIVSIAVPMVSAILGVLKSPLTPTTVGEKVDTAIAAADPVKQ